jgi:hypothetical protein
MVKGLGNVTVTAAGGSPGPGIKNGVCCAAASLRPERHHGHCRGNADGHFTTT